MNKLKTAFSLSLLSAACILPAQDKQKMNVLFIAVDDLKPALGCYGDTQAVTPNIDALAGQGTLFMRNYCQQAVCGVTRPSIMTGLRPDQTQVWTNNTPFREGFPDAVTMPMHFTENGYYTISGGKIFHGNSDRTQDTLMSWDRRICEQEFRYPEQWGEPHAHGYQSREMKERIRKATEQAKKIDVSKIKGLPKGGGEFQYVKSISFLLGESPDGPDNIYQDGQVTQIACDMMADLARSDKPFFLAVGLLKPHVPFCAPKKYWDLYDPAKFKLAEFRERAADSPDFAYGPSLEAFTYLNPWGYKASMDNGIVRMKEEQERYMLHGYYASVSYTDSNVGTLLAALKANGLDKNTIVVLWGDHGWHLGDHSLWAKYTNFENAARAPLIIADPRAKKGNVTYQLTEFVDVFPTLCDLAGIPRRPYMAGTSLKPLLYGKEKPVKDVAFSQYLRGNDVMGYSARTDRYRYTAWVGGTPYKKDSFGVGDIVAEELYDYEKDPLETKSLQNDPKYKKVKDELRAKLMDHFVEWHRHVHGRL